MSYTRFLLACTLLFAATSSSYAADQQWIRVSSEHFTVLTDAGDKRGREVLLRFEQMRGMFAELLQKTRVNLSKPLEIIAFKSDKEYAQVAPIVNGGPLVAPGFFLPGEDRNYIVLNLFEDDSWRAVSYDFAHMLLNFNYPPTQSWFDVGFAEYFSSLRLDNRQAELGADPTVAIAHARDLGPRQSAIASRTFVDVLSAPTWMRIADLFAATRDTCFAADAAHSTIYEAESWIVMHYLVNSNKMSETGTYFQLVELDGVPIEQAIQKAYGLSASEFEAAVRNYFQLLKPQFEGQVPPKNATAFSVHAYASPIPADTMGASTKQVTEPQARALVAEMAARIPTHREQAIGQLQSVIADPKTDNGVAHRALASIHMQKKEFDEATEELGKAAELDPNDPWVRYELALVKYHQAQSSGGEFHGLANMLQDLRATVDWDPDFADAYHLLALARLEGGGNNSALEAERAAMALSPRNLSYVLGMANIYIALKKWDAATVTLERLKTSSDRQIAHAAAKTLNDLPSIKKYGILPQPTEAAGSQPPSSRRESPLSAQSREQPQTTEGSSEEKQNTTIAASTSPDTGPDRRPVQFTKGKILAVDCSQAPAAVITVASGARKMRFRTADYKSLLLIGADQFSCDWKNVAAAVNYKAGKTEGDLVSLEIQ